MGEAMRRRELIAFVGSTAVAWPLMARAQGSVAIVAFAVSGSRANQDPIAAFEAGLKDMGSSNLTGVYQFTAGLKCPAWTCRPSTAASVPGKASARPELDNSQDPKRTRTVQDFLQRKFILKPISPVANPCCSPTLKPA
jgi:hypothetical protein